MDKKLYRSNDRRLFGVCGGLAEYIGMDPTIVRFLWIILTMSGGSGIVIYLVAALLMDNRPDYVSRYEENSEGTVQ